MLFERHGNALKKMKLDPTDAFQEINHKVSEAFYVVALETVKCSQNGGNCAGKWTGEKTCSTFTIKVSKEISNMAIDIKDQVVQHLAQFQFKLMNRLMWNRLSSCWDLQDMCTQVHLKRSVSFVLLLKQLPRPQIFWKRFHLSLNRKSCVL